MEYEVFMLLYSALIVVSLTKFNLKKVSRLPPAKCICRPNPKEKMFGRCMREEMCVILSETGHRNNQHWSNKIYHSRKPTAKIAYSSRRNGFDCGITCEREYSCASSKLSFVFVPIFRFSKPHVSFQTIVSLLQKDFHEAPSFSPRRRN